MKEKIPKIKFYSMPKKNIEKSIINGENIDTSKEIKTSLEYNKALISVIKQDIKSLVSSFKKAIKNITRISNDNNITLDLEINDDIKSVDNILLTINSMIKKLKINKSKIKIRLFTFHRTEKKKLLKKLEEDINILIKYKNDIIGMKNEYDKLNDRLNKMGNDLINEKESVNEEKEDPLERTINFYLNKR